MAAVLHVAVDTSYLVELLNHQTAARYRIDTMTEERAVKSDREILDQVAVFGVTGWTRYLLSGYDTESAIRFLEVSGLSSAIMFWLRRLDIDTHDCIKEIEDDFSEGERFSIFEALDMLIAHGLMQMRLKVAVGPAGGGASRTEEIEAKGNWRSAIHSDTRMTLLDYLNVSVTPLGKFLIAKHGEEDVDRGEYVFDESGFLRDIVETKILNGNTRVLRSYLSSDDEDCRYLVDHWPHLTEDVKRRILELSGARSLSEGTESVSDSPETTASEQQSVSPSSPSTAVTGSAAFAPAAAASPVSEPVNAITRPVSDPMLGEAAETSTAVPLSSPANGRLVPDDVCTIAIAITEFDVSEKTIRRKIRDEELTNYGRPSAKAMLVSRSELARFFTKFKALSRDKSDK